MKRFNLGKGSPKTPGEGTSLPGERQGPRKSILIIGITVILLATAYWVATNFIFVPPPPPARPSLPPLPAPAPPPPAPTPPPAAVKVEPPPPEKPEAKPPKVEETAPAPKAGPRYTLQVGAMIQRRSAMDLQKRLERLGYETRIKKGTSSRTRYMVYIGEVGSMREAEATVRRLQQDGFPARVVSTQGGFLSGIGDFFALDEAIDLAHELQKKNRRPPDPDHVPPGAGWILPQ